MVAIIIPTLNRIIHLKRCVESLQRNTYASEVDLYISVDFPPDKKYYNGYEDVCEYVKTIRGFRSTKYYYQNDNLGPNKNTFFLEKCVENDGINEIIYTEDDNEFSPNFIEFCVKGLEKFRNIPEIIAVCGWSNISSGYDRDSYCALPYKLPYGYGYWLSKQKLIREYLNNEYWESVLFDNKKLIKMFLINKRAFWTYAQDTKRYIHAMRDDDDNLLEIDWVGDVLIALNGWRAVYPVIRQCRNHGFDGSGVNASKEEDTDDLFMDIDTNCHFNYTNQLTDEQCKKEWRRIKKTLDPGAKEMIKAILYIVIEKIKKHKDNRTNYEA